jgi:hypothetical protein
VLRRLRDSKKEASRGMSSAPEVVIGVHDNVWGAWAERPGRWQSGRMKRRSNPALQEENPAPVASDVTRSCRSKSGCWTSARWCGGACWCRQNAYLSGGPMICKALAVRDAAANDEIVANFDLLEKAIREIERQSGFLEEIKITSSTIKNGAQKILN